MNAYEIALALEDEPSRQNIESAKKWLNSNFEHDQADCIFKLLSAYEKEESLREWIDKSLESDLSRAKVKLALRYTPTAKVIEKSIELIRQEPSHFDLGAILEFLLKNHKNPELVSFSIEWLKKNEFLEYGDEIFQLLLEGKHLSQSNLEEYSCDESSAGLLNSFIKNAPSSDVLKYSICYLNNFPGSVHSGFVLTNLIKKGVLKNPDKHIDHWIDNGGKQDILIQIASDYFDQVGRTEYLKDLCKKFAGKRVPKAIWANRFLLQLDKTDSTRDWLLSWLSSNLDHEYAGSYLELLLNYYECDEIVSLAKKWLKQTGSDDRYEVLLALLEDDIVDTEILEILVEQVKDEGFGNSELSLYLLQHQPDKFLPIAKELIFNPEEDLVDRANLAVSYLMQNNDDEVSNELKALRDYASRLEPERRRIHWWYPEFRYICYLLDKFPTDDSVQKARLWLKEFGKDDRNSADVVEEKIRCVSRT